MLSLVMSRGVRLREKPRELRGSVEDWRLRCSFVGLRMLERESTMKDTFVGMVDPMPRSIICHLTIVSSFYAVQYSTKAISNSYSSRERTAFSK
jgi:hypothetical protein